MSIKLEDRVTMVENALVRFTEAIAEDTRKLKVEMSDFKDEMAVFKDEMSDFKDEMREDRKKMNKQWGELANKMGTLVEDIILPGIRPLLKEYFKTEVDFLASKMFRHFKATGKKGEFDIVATDEERVFLIEVKSSPNREKLDIFVEKQIPLFRDLYPEYSSKRLIPFMGSLNFSDDLVPYASQKEVYLVAYREWEYLDFLNFEEIN